MTHPPIRIAVSGSYSSGKTTTTEALSIATGIPRTHALTSRQIIGDILPGRGDVSELSATELLTLGLRRFEERVQGESSQPGSFISDGSVVHEWVYAEARMRVGLNPGAPLLRRAATRAIGLPMKPFVQRALDAYGTLTKARAKRTYDVFIHLPVEFEMERDGYRPVSERYRLVCDELLIEALHELEIPYHVVRGSVEQRVQQVVELLALPVEVPIDEAIEAAHVRTREAREAAERITAHRAPETLRHRIRLATRL